MTRYQNERVDVVRGTISTRGWTRPALATGGVHWRGRPHRVRLVSLLGVAVDASASTADGLRMALALAGPQTDEGEVHRGIRRWLQSVHSL